MSDLFGLPADHSAPIYIEHAVHNSADLDALTNIVKSREMALQAGDIIITVPQERRYRNDCTYIWDSEGSRLHAMTSAIDDYGVCPPALVVQVGQPINLYCRNNAHNNIWWPCPEMRQAIKEACPTYVNDSVSYVELPSAGMNFRFYIEPESNLDAGEFTYLPDEYESRDGGVYLEAKKVPGVVLCSVGAGADTDMGSEELCYDDWDQ